MNDHTIYFVYAAVVLAAVPVLWYFINDTIKLLQQ
jgi:hypothetical protein